MCMSREFPNSFLGLQAGMRNTSVVIIVINVR